MVNNEGEYRVGTIVDIKQDTNTTITASTADTLWLVHVGVDVTTTGTAIDAHTDAIDRSFLIRGQLASAQQDGILIGSFGHEVQSINNSVEIEAGGEIHAGGNGVEFYGSAIDIDNDGVITGDYAVAGQTSNGEIDNNGKLIGRTGGLFVEGFFNEIHNGGQITSENLWAVEVKGDHNTFVNSGLIEHTSDIAAALFLNTRIDDGERVTNTGSIIGGKTAIFGNFGSETVVNKGYVKGDVDLGDGADRFVNAHGFVDGQIRGGLGSDTYVIDDASLNVYEKAGEGIDLVRSSATYTLRDNFDNLTLTGRVNTDGTGNSLANILKGSNADNTLSGGIGADLLSGGRGTDVLTGGADADVFQFGRHFGTDHISDFTNGVDHIKIGFGSSVDDFSDLVPLFHTSGNDVAIVFNAHDLLIIDNVKIADLDTSDFTF
jgi:Ca2+-binding RTX toxin-like protein